jgi:hypothetical protein
MLDVMILNAYHRGDWLVEQYKNTPYAVETLDISEVVGPREPEDLHGPFGLFADVDPTAQDWFSKNRELSPQKEGWVLWTDEGTFQSKGPFRAYQAQQMGVLSDTVLKSWLSTTDRPAQMWRGLPPVLQQSENGYLLSKAFQTQPEQRRTVKAQDSFNITSAPGHKIIKWQEHTFEAHFVVSFLLPHELMARAAVGLNQLLSGEALRPRLCWQRARFRIETPFALDSLPEQFCLVAKTHEPWFEENLLVLQRASQKDEWDVWFRTWYDVHKEKKYFSGLQKRLQGVLLSRVPDAAITCVRAPVETTEKLAHSLYPVYDLQEWTLHTKFFANNVFHGAGDKYENYSPSQMLAIQAKIYKQIDEELKGG